mgnify:CR=1 FL=1
MTLGYQFKEHMALRKELGGLIGENRRLNPLPSDVDGASHGRPGSMAEFDSLGEKNEWLKEKIASTTVSNEIGRGEREPTKERFG